MEDLDFSQSQPAKPQPTAKAAERPVTADAPPYDKEMAVRFFRVAGEEVAFDVNTRVFAEGEKTSGLFSKGARIYLLLEGQIALTLKGKPLHLVLPGEIFGEMAIISEAPRSATATALKKSRVLALDEKRFLAALPREPEFALLLVGVLAAQMRRGVERLLSANAGPLAVREDGRGLNKAQLADIRRMLGDPEPTAMAAGDAIVSKGALGVYMFVLTAGQVAISVGDTVVERLGAGEIFGETALLGPTSRAATAVAESDGAWLPVTRNAFLDIVKKQPAIGIALLRSLSGRLQHLNEQISAQLGAN